MSDEHGSTFDRMRAGVDAAHAAADRLVREAEAEARARAARAEEAMRAATGGMPAGGWAAHSAPPPADEGPGEAVELLRAVMKLLDLARGVVRESVPPELLAQLAQALRELLLVVRALIDWYVERLEQAPAAGSGRQAAGDVEDIPIV